MVAPHDSSSSTRICLYRTWRGQDGGQAYARDIERALSPGFDVVYRDLYPKRLTSLPGRRIRQLLAALPDANCDVTIRGFLPTVALAFRRARGRQITLIHHLDHSPIAQPLMSSILERFFTKALPRAHRLVVVSPYWKKQFSALVPEMPIDIIHNGFDVDAYAVSPEDCRALRDRFGLDERPLVYLGNCRRGKGVIEAYEALHHLPYQLVTSGRREVDVPCTHLDLTTGEYRQLLAAADVVLAVSIFQEGWNRTAHEALLAGTPVVGIPAGGLGDLLEGAGQLTVSGFHELPAAVAEALSRPEPLVAAGRSFARQFTLDRFHESWRRVVHEEADRAGS